MALAAWRSASAGDVVAGLTVAATSLPQYIAYAELAGLSGLQGLRTSGPPLLAFAAVTGSPLLNIGVTSITAIMAHAALGGSDYRETKGEEAWAELMGAFAVLVGLASVALAGLGATRLVAFIPAPVKTGWKLGFAITVVASQAAGAVFGAGSNFVKASCTLPRLALPWRGTSAPLSGGAAAMYRLAWMLAQPQLWDPAAAGLSAMALLLVLGGRAPLRKALRAASRRPLAEPMAGLEVILATAAGTLVAMCCGYQGGVVGRMPAMPGDETALTAANGDVRGLLQPLTSWVRQWPWEMPWGELADRLGGWPWAAASVLAFAAVDFLAIVSVVESGPLTRELAGQGVACVVSGLAGSAPVGGSLSRSLVAKMTGATSPLAGLVSGLATLALATPSVAGLLAPTPKAILAAVVLSAVLPSVVHPKEALRLRGGEALIGWTTAAVSTFSDPTTGFGAGLAMHALLQPLRHRKVG